MEGRLKKTKSLYLLLYLFCALILIGAFGVGNNYYTGRNWYLFESIVVTISLILLILMFIKLKIRLFSLSALFIWCSYLFNFGQVILYGFFVDETYIGNNYIEMYSADIYKPAIFIVFVIQMCVALGILIGHKRDERNQTIGSFDYQEDIRNCKLINKVCWFIFFPIEVFFVLLKLNAGYLGSFDITQNDGLATLGRFFIIGFVLSLYLTSGKKRLLVLLLEIAWLAFSMLSGDRHYAAANILTILSFFFLFRTKKKISIISIILLVIFVFFGMTMLETINFARHTDMSLAELENAFTYTMTVRNPLFAFLNEFGASIYTPIAAYDYVTNISPTYGYGSSFLLSWVYIFPNIGGMTKTVTSSINYGMIIQAAGIRGGFRQIGGDYAGELIYNFRYLYPFFSIALGWFVSKISGRVDFLAGNKQMSFACFYLMAFNGIIFFVRSYFYGFIRQWAWSAIILLLILSLSGCNIFVRRKFYGKSIIGNK